MIVILKFSYNNKIFLFLNNINEAELYFRRILIYLKFQFDHMKESGLGSLRWLGCRPVEA